MKKLLLFKKIIIVILLAGLSSAGWAQVPFTKGNIAVLRVGDGVAALTNASTAAFIDEYTTTGTFVQSIAIPTTGLNKLTNAGTSGTEGLISLSPDGQYLTLAGYDIAPGTAAIAATKSVSIKRKLLRIDNSVNYVSILSDTAFSGGNPRSGVTTGTDYWASGSNQGIRYLGTGTPTLVSSTTTNIRAINIFNGQLYYSTGSGTIGIWAVGNGLPTATSQISTNIINTGLSGTSPNAFAFNSTTDVCYVADDRTVSPGGVQKWTKSGGVWSLSYVLSVGASVGARGLIVDWSEANTVIYATTTATLSKLVKITDTGAGSIFTDLTTSSTNTAFRGIAFAPVPATIIPTLTITAPVTDNLWTQGTSHNISWTATGTNANVKIEYYNASDDTWNTINASIAANAGAWSWDIPAGQPTSTDSKIRITDIPETVSALSGIFSVTAAPTPVATFNPADAAIGVDITSNIIIAFDVPVRNLDNSEITDANVASLLNLKTTDASGIAIPYTATIDAAKKVITINPDADLAYEQVYYVAVAPVEGLSDNATLERNITFKTAANLAPALSDVTITEVALYAGDVVTINWVSKNITNVKIEVWIPSENKWDELTASTPSDGTETFPIPVEAPYSTDYKIRITDLANAAVTAESSIFTIIGAISEVNITEIAPYYAGNSITVKWAAKNILTVKIELFDPATSTWSGLASAVTAADGSKLVSLPITLAAGTTYKIRVSDEASNAASESSTFVVNAVVVVNDLLTLRAQPLNTIVKYTGIATVTYARTSRNQKYIQDATAAVVIDDPTVAPGFITGTYNIGDGITNVVGKITIYGLLVELTPLFITGEPATGTAIVPEVRTLASLTADDQCKLVKIENFAFKSPRKIVKSLTYAIDGYDSLSIAYRTLFAESDYIGGQAPVGPISSVVLVGQYNAQMQITARFWSDMTVPTVADFNADKTFALTGENVTFTDMSSNHPTNWEWTFDGGTPATSTEQNPVVTYSAKGTYAVTLKATNAAGGTNTVTKTDYISTGVVGISTQSSMVSVYPNPTNGRLFITNASKDTQEITVFSAIGKQVNSSVSADGIISLDLKSQTKGMYLIRITNKNTKSVQVKKVVLY